MKRGEAARPERLHLLKAGNFREWLVNGTARAANPSRSDTGSSLPRPAGREREIQQFEKLLEQDDVILQNPLLAGLEGAEKTALVETFRSCAQQKKWVWVGIDLAASAGLTEERLAGRLLTNLAAVTSSWKVAAERTSGMGFIPEFKEREIRATIGVLREIFNGTPGLARDKLKKIVALAGQWAREQGFRGIVFGCDGVQTLSEREPEDEFPLALLLDVFQSVQRAGVPAMLLLSGLPALPPKLIEARTFSERMFRTIPLTRPNGGASRTAGARSASGRPDGRQP